jgi:hypothetical protein
MLKEETSCEHMPFFFQSTQLGSKHRLSHSWITSDKAHFSFNGRITIFPLVNFVEYPLPCTRMMKVRIILDFSDEIRRVQLSYALNT